MSGKSGLSQAKTVNVVQQLRAMKLQTAVDLVKNKIHKTLAYCQGLDTYLGHESIRADHERYLDEHPGSWCLSG